MNNKLKINTILSFATFLIFSNVAYAKPYIPNTDTEVLVLLKKDSQNNKFKEIKSQLELYKSTPSKTLEILQETFEYGKTTSNPKYIGFTSAYINQYLRHQKNNIGLKILKANILQHDHKFTDAIKLLNNIIKKVPSNPNARLMRAAVLQTQAQYSQAIRDCYSLVGKTSHLITVTCIAQTKGLTDNAENYYSVLNKVLLQDRHSSAAELSWAYDILAQLALQKGDQVKALEHLKTGLKYSPSNISILNAYADILISNKQFQKVISKLDTYSKDFTSLLRLTIAEKFSSTNVYYQDKFITKMKQMNLLFDTTHQREISAYYLYVENNISSALKYAAKNWLVQKELYDAQLLLKCALLNNSAQAAQPVIDWYNNNSISDTRLKSLIDQIQQLEAVLWTHSNSSKTI